MCHAFFFRRTGFFLTVTRVSRTCAANGIYKLRGVIIPSSIYRATYISLFFVAVDPQYKCTSPLSVPRKVFRLVLKVPPACNLTHPWSNARAIGESIATDLAIGLVKFIVVRVFDGMQIKQWINLNFVGCIRKLLLILSSHFCQKWDIKLIYILKIEIKKLNLLLKLKLWHFYIVIIYICYNIYFLLIIHINYCKYAKINLDKTDRNNVFTACIKSI